MTSREKFEAFLVSEYEWGNDALNAANFHGDDATGYYTGGDFIYDGQSCSECLFWAWRGWQAAELASEQKLTDMAVQLANAESKCRELAAENSAIKVMNDCLSEEMRGYESDGAFEGPKMHLLWWKTETPVTEAFLAEVRAQESKRVYESILDNPAVTDMASLVDWLEQYANDSVAFAAQLRKGAAL